MTVQRYIISLLGVGMLAIAVGLILHAVVIPGMVHKNSQVRVPDILEYTADDAFEITSSAGLQLRVLRREFHSSLPEGVVIEAKTGTSVCKALLDNGIEIEHACEMSNACTTCHVYVREGFESMEESDEIEDDLLDKAWGLDPDSRLSCQAIVSEEDIVIEIPKYTINQVSENH